jgi:hypothetical protein
MPKRFRWKRASRDVSAGDFTIAVELSLKISPVPWFNAGMAKQTVVSEVLVDDLDGSPGDRTVSFTWDGVSYEIELSKKNIAAFEKALKPYLDAGRRIRRSRGRRAGGARSGKRDVAAIRDWAVNNGFAVSARGRVASSIVDAYEAANP